MSGRKGMSPIIRVFVFYSPRLGSICFGEEATISRSWRISKVVDRWLRSPVAKNHLVFEYQTQLGSRLAWIETRSEALKVIWVEQRLAKCRTYGQKQTDAKPIGCIASHVGHDHQDAYQQSPTA